MRPEDALDAARRAVAEARARGAYGDDLSGFTVEPTDRIATEQLLEWAVIEPDIDLVRSTRRWGGPITWAKRGLVRSTRRWGGPITWAKRALVHVLRQYLGQIVAEQTRFNLHAAVRLAELEERIERLEKPSD